MMSTGVPSDMNGMSSSEQDLRDDALVAVASGELVALVADLALLGDVDLHQLIDAGLHLVVFVAAVDLDVDDLAGLAVGNLQ